MGAEVAVLAVGAIVGGEIVAVDALGRARRRHHVRYAGGAAEDGPRLPLDPPVLADRRCGHGAVVTVSTECDAAASSEEFNNSQWQ